MLRKVSLFIVTVALASTVPAAGQNAQFVVGEAQLGYLQTLTAAQVSCVGGEPTGLPFPPCSEGTSRALSRSEVQAWWPFSLSTSVAGLLTGPITFVVNCNMSAEYRGPCWGTFEWDVPGGKWAGNWTAPVMDLMTYESKLSMVGFGQGGELDGKHLRFEGGSAPYGWYITGTVRIH